ITDLVFSLLNETFHYLVGDMNKIPVCFPDNEISKNYVIDVVDTNINISKNDWNSFETSWNFEKHPLVNFASSNLKSSYNQWQEFAENQFYQLKENEEKLNEIFIDIYGLQDELTPDVAEEDVTVRKADLERDIKSFISYAVGCTFGRYSLDEDGLIYAGGEFDPT